MQNILPSTPKVVWLESSLRPFFEVCVQLRVCSLGFISHRSASVLYFLCTVFSSLIFVSHRGCRVPGPDMLILYCLLDAAVRCTSMCLYLPAVYFSAAAASLCCYHAVAAAAALLLAAAVRHRMCAG